MIKPCPYTYIRILSFVPPFFFVLLGYDKVLELEVRHLADIVCIVCAPSSRPRFSVARPSNSDVPLVHLCICARARLLFCF